MEFPSSRRISHLFSEDTHERVNVIPHRTITHTTLLWALETIYSVYFWYLQNGAWQSLVLFAFCVSGLAHLLCDASTPMGVPLLPFGKRYRITSKGVQQAHTIQKHSGWFV